VPAVKRPLALMVPPPEVVQSKVGWVDRLAPNWSRAVAVNCCVADTFTLALVGATATLVKVWSTVTLVALVVVIPAWSAMVTWKLKVPALLKVAVVFLAALVPLALKVTPVAGVAAQV